LKVVVDCSNGSAYKITPYALNELGADVIPINDTPDGININADCGAAHPEAMQRAVLKHKADIGIAHDGDADRTILCDEKGEIVDGDKIMAVCAMDMKKDGNLNNNTVIATVMSNIGFELFLKKSGIKVVRTKVGDRYVVEEMLKRNCNLGGEQSGHIIFLDYNSTGDGPITALQVLSAMCRREKSLSELVSYIPIYPQVLVNVHVRKLKNMEDFPDITSAIKKARKKLNSGRILVRPSGTEPKIRVMVEGDNMDNITSIAEDIAEVIKSNMK
jgi:phosphoglucosamine mutase